jgi:hypothetical protein
VLRTKPEVKRGGVDRVEEGEGKEGRRELGIRWDESKK